MHVGEAFVYEDGAVVGIFQIGENDTERNGFCSTLGESCADLCDVSILNIFCLSVFESYSLRFGR